MENCLVTKLKGVVDNPNLEKFGVLELTFANGKSDFLKFDAATTIKLLSGTFKDGTTERTLAANEIFYFTPNNVNFDGNDEVVVEFPKYHVSGIGYSGEYDVEKFFEYSSAENIELYSANNGEGTLLNATPYMAKVGSRFVWTGNVGDAVNVTDLGMSGVLQDVFFRPTSSNNITGSYDNLGLCPLTRIMLSTSLTSINLDNFVKKAISKGRTTYSISNFNIDALVNSNRAILGGDVLSYGGDYQKTKTLSWQPSSTTGYTDITLSDGASINITATISNN